MDTNNNTAMVAFKAELKEEVFGQEETETAYSQVVMGAGEVEIKEEMVEVPSDVGENEAPSEEEEEDDDPFCPSTNLLLEVEDDGHVVVGGDVGEDDSEEVLVSLLASLAASSVSTSFTFRMLPACMVPAESAMTSLLSLLLCPLWQCSPVGVPLPNSWTLVRRRVMRLRMGVM